MKLKRIIFIALLIAIALISDRQWSDQGNEYYKIISEVGYNPEFCDGIGYYYEPDGFDSGVRVIAKDKISGVPLYELETTVEHYGGGGSVGSEEYSCEEKMKDGNSVGYIYAKGYSPIAFSFTYPSNKMATIEASLVKSCTGGPSYWDNQKVLVGLSPSINVSDREEYYQLDTDYVYDSIQEGFGVDKNDYKLTCTEGVRDRGGFIKGEGIYKDGTAFEFYQRWGWCSSGGSDCEDTTCFDSTSSELSHLNTGENCLEY